jgi:hypothetical protein
MYYPRIDVRPNAHGSEVSSRHKEASSATEGIEYGLPRHDVGHVGHDECKWSVRGGGP